MSDVPLSPNRYAQIIERIFFSKYNVDVTTITFVREDLELAAKGLSIRLPKNLGDILYSFKYRAGMPARILETAPEGKTWILKNVGRAAYAFVLVNDLPIRPNPLLEIIKIPDATPEIVAMYAFGDEQALLNRLRYNRLIDIFTGLTCYSLQNHLRTTVAGIGQIETDEIYVIPIQAKRGNDRLNIVQIEQDIALCAARFQNLICRPVGAQFMDLDTIALFEFKDTSDGIM
ncbi:MAG: endonuclease, partial [Chloroflexota bacterium]|nr:endonuclease [Chloroflexota bacterium]